MGSVWSGTVGAEDTCLHCGPSLGGKQLIDIHTLVHDAWVESQDAIIRPCSGSRVPSLQDPTVVFEQCTGRSLGRIRTCACARLPSAVTDEAGYHLRKGPEPRSAPDVPLGALPCLWLPAANALLQRLAAASAPAPSSSRRLRRQPGRAGRPPSPQAEPGHLRHQPVAADPKLGPHPLDRPPLLQVPALQVAAQVRKAQLRQPDGAPLLPGD
jgi:hypothetical protein